MGSLRAHSERLCGERHSERLCGELETPLHLISIKKIQIEGILDRCPNMAGAIECLTEPIYIERGGRQTVIECIIAYTI